MTNSINSIQSNIKIKGQKLGTVKNLAATASDDNSKEHCSSDILKPSKMKLVVSVFLYAWES